MTASRSSFWEKHRGLIWSNPEAEDSAYIRAALLRPRFSQLLDIAVEFGLKRVRQEWEILQAERTPEIARAHRIVERILRHIEEGFDRVAP